MTAQTTADLTRPAKPVPTGIDPRGPRFGAAVTAVLLAVVILLGQGAAATAALAVVVASFALGAVKGTQGTVQGVVFRLWVRPRLAPPAHLEDPRPPRFAQLVGLVITGIGLVVAVAGAPGAVTVAASLALVAATLNATIGLCLGCELYLLVARLRAR